MREFHVVVVDDEPHVMEGICQSLQSAARQLGLALRTEGASSATDALSRLSVRPADALVVDYRLQGGMSGAELIERLPDPFERLFIRLVSGQEEDELEPTVIGRQRVMGNRFRFLKKPVTPLQWKTEVLALAAHVEAQPYPHLMALTLARVSQPESQFGRLKAVQDALETALKHVTLFIAADLIQRGVQITGGASRGFKQQLTLAPWLHCADLLAQQYRIDGQALCAGLADAIRSSRKGLVAALHAMKSVRDSEIAHGYLGEEAGFELRANEGSDRLERVMEGLRPLKDFEWLVQERVALPQEETDVFEYEVVRLGTSSDLFPRVRWRSRQRLASGHVIVLARDGRTLDLHPFFAWQTCEQCRRRRLFMLDNWHEQSATFVYRAECNHLLSNAALTSAMTTANAKLFG